MIVLAIESATLAGGVALLDDGQLIEEQVLDISLTYSEKLLPAVDRILAGNRLSIKEIGLIAVDVGPGSFTGLRIGLATAQGLSFPQKIPVVGVVSLEAMVEGASAEVGDLVSPLIDARRGEVYAGLYRRTAGTIAGIIAPVAVAPGEWQERIREQGESVTVIGPGTTPLPSAVGRLGWKYFQEKGERVGMTAPLYLRRPV